MLESPTPVLREYREDDWDRVWPIIRNVFRAGETYAYASDITEQEAHRVWIDLPQATYVAVDELGEIAGTYYIKPNQPDRGAHVCNCGYIVSEGASGKGIASHMCRHSQEIAVKRGFKAMQFNLVVSTNAGAIHLWRKLGFQIVGTLPNAYNSKRFGLVDALVMYKEL